MAPFFSSSIWPRATFISKTSISPLKNSSYTETILLTTFSLARLVTSDFTVLWFHPILKNESPLGTAVPAKALASSIEPTDLWVWRRSECGCQHLWGCGCCWPGLPGNRHPMGVPMTSDSRELVYNSPSRSALQLGWFHALYSTPCPRLCFQDPMLVTRGGRARSTCCLPFPVSHIPHAHPLPRPDKLFALKSCLRVSFWGNPN